MVVGEVGTLEAVKGDSGLMINVKVSNAGEQGAYALAREALRDSASRWTTMAHTPRRWLPSPRTPRDPAIHSLVRASSRQLARGEPEHDESGRQCT